MSINNEIRRQVRAQTPDADTGRSARVNELVASSFPQEPEAAQVLRALLEQEDTTGGNLEYVAVAESVALRHAMSDPKYQMRGADGQRTFDGVGYLNDLLEKLDGANVARMEDTASPI